MIIQVKNFWPKYRRYLIGLVLCIWGTVVFFALSTNPTARETHAKLQIMKNDMSALMEQGGKVIRSQENAKYGNALVSRLVSDEGWSNALLERYKATLATRGWKKLDALPMSYCKDGILAELKPNSGIVDGIGTNYISMFYDLTTIRRCAAI